MQQNFEKVWESFFAFVTKRYGAQAVKKHLYEFSLEKKAVFEGLQQTQQLEHFLYVQVMEAFHEALGKEIAQEKYQFWRQAYLDHINSVGRRYGQPEITMEEFIKMLEEEQQELDLLSPQMQEFRAQRLVQEIRKAAKDLQQEEKHRQQLLDRRKRRQAEEKVKQLIGKCVERHIEEFNFKKGMVRVFCRIKPINVSIPRAIKPQGYNQVVLRDMVKNLTGKMVEDFKIFRFQEVFGQQCSQLRIFEKIRQSVHNLFSGKNACIFAYGQSNSGKKYTLLGPKNFHFKDMEQKQSGLIQRQINLVFEIIQRASKSMTYEVKLSLCEIYNDRFFNLLGNKEKQQVESVEDLPSLQVKTRMQALENLQKAIKKMPKYTVEENNEGRSHFVFKLSVKTTKYPQMKQTIGSMLILGLEPCCSYKDNKQIEQEGTEINKQISSLILLLKELKINNVSNSFRNSRLNLCLKECLTNGIAYVFLHASPELKHSQKTKNTLFKGLEMNNTVLTKKNT